MNVAIDLAALLVQRAESFVKPWRTAGKVRFNERVNDLMHQSAAARRDVHHQSFMRAGEIAVGRGRLGAE